MNDRFTLLECDDDVLSFFNQTFKLSNFRKRVNLEFNRKLNQYSQNEASGLFGLYIEGITIQSSNINWHSTIINCEILRLGYKHWQSGKLRIQLELEGVDVTHEYSHGRHTSRKTTKEIKIQQICLEFCPDELEVNRAELPLDNICQPESSLDDIRQMMNGNS